MKQEENQKLAITKQFNDFLEQLRKTHPDGVTIDELILMVAKQRQNYIVPEPAELSGLSSGFSVQEVNGCYRLGYDKRLTGLARQHVVLHELVHILLGDADRGITYRENSNKYEEIIEELAFLIEGVLITEFEREYNQLRKYIDNVIE